MLRIADGGGATCFEPTPPPVLQPTPAPTPTPTATAATPTPQANVVAARGGYDQAAYLRARTEASLPYCPASSAATTKPVSEMSATEKLGEVLRRSLSMMPAEVRDKVAALLEPQSLALIAGGLALWAGSHAIGVGEVIDVVLAVAGGIMLGMEAFHVAGDIKDFIQGTLGAKSEADLDDAARHFARAVSTVGVDTVVVLLTHKAAGEIEGSLPRPPAATRELVTPEGVRIRVPIEPEPLGQEPVRMSGDGGGAGVVREPITAANVGRVTVPGVRGGEFARWFNSLSKGEMDVLWGNGALRATIEARLRSPGGYHEWLPVSRAPKFREWGVTFEQIQQWRTPTRTLRFVNPEGRHGGVGSSTAHNEIFDLVDRARSFAEFKSLLQAWANNRLPGGAASLPEGLRP